jgi:uncharacterized SAM-binding protein YcdF (DUF218 family)
MEFGFLIKKFITFFLEPYGLVLTLFVIGLFSLFVKKYKPAKIFLSLACGTLFLFAYPPFSNALVQGLENEYPKYDYTQKAKYIHVLGNGHNSDASQPLSSQIGSAGVKRVLEGVLIHKQLEGSKLIFTGYEGTTNIANAKMNASLAMALGVDDKNIIIFSDPKDTKEEALFTQSLLGDEAFVLVTSATHMLRSMQLFESLGLNPIAAPTDFLKDEYKGLLREPTIGNLEASQRAIHEYIGLLWNRVRSFL